MSIFFLQNEKNSFNALGHPLWARLVAFWAFICFFFFFSTRVHSDAHCAKLHSQKEVLGALKRSTGEFRRQLKDARIAIPIPFDDRPHDGDTLIAG